MYTEGAVKGRTLDYVFYFLFFANLTANNFCHSGTETARYRATRSTRLRNLFALLLIYDFTQWTAEMRLRKGQSYLYNFLKVARCQEGERNTWTIPLSARTFLSPPERSADGQTETTFYLGTWCRLVRECIKGVLFL